MAENTPMMQQYRKIKAENPDSILFFRLGDFYEMFDEDAAIASKELDLTLTTRDRSRPKEEQTPMCGVPYHSCQGYIARLIAKGYKVAICEQMEDPALAKGLVLRDVTRVVTPGTVMDSGMLADDGNNYIAGIFSENEIYGLCLCDVTTGEMKVTAMDGSQGREDAFNELYGAAPRECVLGGAAAADEGLKKFIKERLDCRFETKYQDLFAEKTAETAVWRKFGEDALNDVPEEKRPAAHAAAGGLLGYLRLTQKSELGQIRRIEVYERSEFMEIDMTARRNLELTKSLRTGDSRGTLLWAMDRTKTAMGHRLLKASMDKPLMDRDAILDRQNGVEVFVQRGVERGEIRRLLGSMGDLERLMGRVIYGNANGRDLTALADTCRLLPEIKSLIPKRMEVILDGIAEDMDTLRDITDLIDRAIVAEPPFSVREGGIIRRGYDTEVDKLNDILGGGSGLLTEMEQRERERTGIKTLKVSYNKVFGYYIEVSKSFVDKVPPEYVRKQTLVSSERYITQELKELENTMFTARDRITDLEYNIFCAVRDAVADKAERVQRTAADIAMLDMLSCFAETAVRYKYNRPLMSAGNGIAIQGGRHPVVEQTMTDGVFVPNDVIMDEGDNRMLIITGPNMAGKSTFMRQIALIQIMAQMGSFVPAENAAVCTVDKIFTRVGASDDLAGGQSTFMLEMSEVAEILRNATRRSLIVLDEIGRGTSTYDGMSIARAVAEYCADKKCLGAKTLFATHYHELTTLEDEVEGVKNYSIAAKKRGDDIIFLRRILPGRADESYGIEVAQLAGVPKSVTKRAKEILKGLETNGAVMAAPGAGCGDEDEQLSFEDVRGRDVLKQLNELDIDVLTPIEAMNILFDLKKKAKDMG